jgi:hypothetical protein
MPVSQGRAPEASQTITTIEDPIIKMGKKYEWIL